MSEGEPGDWSPVTESDVASVLEDPERLRAMDEAGILDPVPEEAFDRITRISKRVLDVPVALINLLDADRQVYKSCVGLPDRLEVRREDPLERSYCKYVVASGEPLVAEDAREHPLLRDSPAIEELDAIAYLGVPLTTRDGHVLGTHCVVDHEPRAWTDEEVELVRDLARAASTEIDLRRDRARLERLRDHLDEQVRERTAALRRSERRLKEAQRIARVGNWEWYPDRGEVHWSDEKFRILGYEPGEVEPSYRAFRRRVHPEDRDELDREAEKVRAGGDSFEGRFRLLLPDGEVRWVHEWARIEKAEGERARRLAGVTQDVTRRLRAEQRLEASERRYRELFEHHVVGVFRSSPGGRLLEVNQALAEILGYDSSDELEGRDARELFPSEEDREVYLERLRSEGKVVNERFRLQRRDGTPIWVLENSLLTEDPASGDATIQGTLVDVTERKRLEDQLRHQALHDPLTGLANRTLLSDRVRQGLARARRRENCLGLLMLDVDRFKRINDNLGHTAGDRVLETIAERLRQTAREADTVARWGGDEFVFVLPDLEDPAEADPVIERIRAVAGRPIRAAGEALRLNLSVGAVVHGVDHPAAVRAEDAEELIRLGTLALHRAKERSAEGVYRLGPGEERKGTGQIHLEQELRRGLEEGRVVPYFQPIVRLEDGEPVGFEALARWRHPDRGIVPPAEFVEVARQEGLIHELGAAILRQGVAEAGEWLDRMGNGNGAGNGTAPMVSFNLAGEQLEDPDFPRSLADELSEAGLAPGRVALEVTETSLMRSPDRVTELQELGVRVYIDDFGTGYSTFAYLRDLDSDGLKIDMGFVQGITGPDSDVEALLEAMVTLGRELGLDVVAEGVETDPQRQRLRDLGCERAQGFHFARPMPADACGEWIRARTG